jgi:hypothetical protein
MQATVGMYDDLQGIAGRSLREIEGLELPLLDAPSPDDAVNSLTKKDVSGEHP